jgi:site-specific DNA recombinase
MIMIGEQGTLPKFLYTYKVDRLTRNITDAARLIRIGNKYGLTVIETGGGTYDLATSNGQVLFVVMCGFAAGSSKVASERIKRKNEATRARGMPTGGRRPFGYSGKMIIIEPEAEALRYAYNAVIQGESMRTIANHINSLGLRTVQGKRAGKGSQSGRPRTEGGLEWTPSAISKCLRKPCYAGILTFQGKEIGPGAWTPIVDADTFYAAQTILTEPSRLSIKGGKRLLTGVAICGVCGAPVNGAGSGQQGGSYGCSKSTHLNRRGDKIDDLVTDAILDRLSDPTVREHTKAPEAPDGTAELYARKRTLDAGLDRLDVALEAGSIDNARHTKRVKANRAEYAEIEATLASMRVAKITSKLRDLQESKDPRGDWDSLSVDARRLVLAEMADIVIHKAKPGRNWFDPNTVDITWKA